MHSLNGQQQALKQLQALFPACVTEQQTAAGEAQLAVDFDLLRQALGDSLIEGPAERYQLNWPGKRQALLTANSPIAKTLRPVREDSVDFDRAEHLFIEGDNLDALKLLQESYLGSVKLIYIDPPYNTGSDFIYKDNFTASAQEFLERSLQKDEYGNALVSNTDTNGRFHSDWLSMMYPRLRIARTLLKDDGVICISIDDDELANLKLLCDEVFGAQCFLNLIAVKSSESSGVKMSHVDKRLPKIKEYILVYTRNIGAARLNPIKIKKEQNPEKLDGYLNYYSSFVRNLDDDPQNYVIVKVTEEMAQRGLPLDDASVRAFKLAHAENVVYRTNNATLAGMTFPTKTAAVISPTGIRYVWWEGKQMLFLSDYLDEYLCDLWNDISTINLNKEMHGLPAFLNGQKPTALIYRLLALFCGSCDGDAPEIVMDFFAGSGSTASAVMQYNHDRGARLRFVLVQLPEEIRASAGMDAKSKKSVKETLQYLKTLGKPPYISEITKARIQRAAQAFSDQAGLRVLRIDTSNMNDVWYSADALTQTQLDFLVDNIRPDRTPDDLLFQVLIDCGLPLTLPLRQIALLGVPVWEVDNGALLACFSPGISEALIREMAALQPERVVFRDDGFENDAVKNNAAQLFLQLSPATELNVL